MKRLRVGARVKRHVYEGDEPLFTAPTDELAEEIVEAVNAFRMGGEVAKRIQRDHDAEMRVIEERRRRQGRDPFARVFGTPGGRE